MLSLSSFNLYIYLIDLKKIENILYDNLQDNLQDNLDDNLDDNI
jgi:hypothetical protein